MRILDFADGFSSATTPSSTGAIASQVESYASDAAFEAVYGSGSDGFIYYNTTDKVIRFYSDGAWRNLGRVEVVAVQSIASAGQIALASSPDQVLKVQGDAGAQSASNTPFSGTSIDGQIIRLEGQDSTNTLTVTNNDAPGGCILNGGATLGKYDTLTLRYDSTDDRYIEQGRNF
jgi:hypothetical protein